MNTMEIKFDVRKLTEDELNTVINLAVEARLREKMDNQTSIISHKKTEDYNDRLKKIFNVEPITQHTIRHKRKRFTDGRKNKYFTLQELDTVWKLYGENKSLKQIARIMGRTKLSIYHIVAKLTGKEHKLSSVIVTWLKRKLPSDNKIINNGKRLSDEEKSQIITMREQGKTYSQISKDVKRSLCTVHNTYNKYERNKRTNGN